MISIEKIELPVPVLERLQSEARAEDTASLTRWWGMGEGICHSLHQHRIPTEAPALPFVIPSEAEGSAVQLARPGNVFRPTGLRFLLSGSHAKPCPVK